MQEKTTESLIQNIFPHSQHYNWNKVDETTTKKQSYLWEKIRLKHSRLLEKNWEISLKHSLKKASYKMLIQKNPEIDKNWEVGPVNGKIEFLSCGRLKSSAEETTQNLRIYPKLHKCEIFWNLNQWYLIIRFSDFLIIQEVDQSNDIKSAAWQLTWLKWSCFSSGISLFIVLWSPSNPIVHLPGLLTSCRTPMCVRLPLAPNASFVDIVGISKPMGIRESSWYAEDLQKLFNE